MYVLKRNLKDQSHKCSLHRPFNGPYTITGRTATGYFLHNRFSHQLVCSVPASQLVQFYENQTYKTNSDNTWFETESTGNSNDMSDYSNDDMVFTLSTNCKGQSCQIANIPNFQQTSTPKKSQDTVSSQIVIVSSKELPMSSDESSTIGVGTECSQPNAGARNPWGDMDINDVPIEIVDDLIFSGDEETTFTDELDIIKKSKAPPVMFNLLTLEDH